MASLNKISIIGNLGADPEIRTLPTGSKVAQIRVATTESYKNKNGEKVEETEWHRIDLWEGLAGVTEQFLKKGDSVYIEGKLKSEKWTDSSGVERFSYKIRANVMQMLGKSQKSETSTPASTFTILSSEVNDGLPF